MTNLEEYAVNQLVDFVETATEQGLCYNGRDIDPQLQLLVIKIVEDYVDGYIKESR